jgi:retinol dehydrogenase-12
MSMLKDKVCIVTGANTGIGAVTAQELAAMGAHVVLACRSEAKTQPVLDRIRAAGGDVSFLHLDLSDLDQVRRAVDAFLATGRALHILVNNAGLAGQRGETAQGFELAFGVNHLGHYLWTRLLMEQLKAHAPARIVNVASAQHKQAKGIDEAALQKKTRSVTGMPEYSVSKLCNVLFTKSLARKYDPAVVSAYSLHPGVVATDVWRRIPAPIAWLMKRRMITVEEGAQTTLHCATNPAVANESGLFYDKCQPRHPNPLAEDEALQDWLWNKSAEWCGLQP